MSLHDGGVLHVTSEIPCPSTLGTPQHVTPGPSIPPLHDPPITPSWGLPHHVTLKVLHHIILGHHHTTDPLSPHLGEPPTPLLQDPPLSPQPVPVTLALKGLPTMWWGPPYLMEMR